MSPFFIVSLVILVILVVALIVLYFSWQARPEKAARTAGKDRRYGTDRFHTCHRQGTHETQRAGFPSIVLESTPKYLRRSKVYVVKAKVGPKIMTFMCDDKVFPLIPVKKEVKATVSGIYITAVRGVRGPLEAPKKKKRISRKSEGIRKESRNGECFQIKKEIKTVRRARKGCSLKIASSGTCRFWRFFNSYILYCHPSRKIGLLHAFLPYRSVQTART